MRTRGTGGRMNGKKRVLCAVIAAFLIFSPCAQMAEAVQPATTDKETLTTTSSDDNSSYYYYQQKYADKPFCNQQLSLDGGQFSSAENVQVVDYEGRKNVAMTGETGSVTYTFSVRQEGLYAINLEYFPLEGNGNIIQRAVYIDGNILVSELNSVEFPRVFKDDSGIISDIQGNDIRPSQSEQRFWANRYIRDNYGYFGDRLYFYFSAGEHIVKLESLQEPMAISKIILDSQKPEIDTYESYLQTVKSQGTSEANGVLTDGILKIQAENTLQKSDLSLYPVNDISSYNTMPYDYAKQKLNTIGGTKWQDVGQWISWEVDVPATGLYYIGFRFKQNFIKQSVRTLYIDDTLQFEEAAEITFPLGDRWQQCLAGGDTPYLFYFTAGKHEIKMEVSLGSSSQYIIMAEQVLKDLNDANWQLMTVLGSSPDTNRDYQLDKYFPEVIENFKSSADTLESIVSGWESMVGERDSSIAEMQQLAQMLTTMSDDPDKVAKMYSYFKDTLTSFSNLIVSVRQQPLLLDYLYLYESNMGIPKEKTNIFMTLKYGCLRFFSSFVNDYSTLSAADGQTDITVWVGNGLSGGRDQAQALNQLILQTFTSTTGINVNLQLVPPNTVLTASIANKGPDIALQVSASDPVNYAMRGAAEDLSGYDGFDTVCENFNQNCLTAFQYQGGVYALPETMSFPMMFYRKDILQKLGIKINDIKTWDDVIKILPVIQSNNMNFGLPAFSSVTVSTAPNTYFMFLYQNGGQIYKDGGRAINLDDKVSLDAFYYYMRFYTSYGLPFIYNFETRFRTGEIPIGISDYTTYNLLQISAPEIQGLWGMTTVPGVKQADGTINTTVPVSVSGCVMMKTAQEKEKCWEFLKWWISENTQYSFGKELESVMGVGARYNTANLKALNRLPWNAADRTVLQKQMNSLKGIPEVPGGYIVARNIDFAVKSVYNTNVDARNKLLSYIDSINEELTSKRQEFHLDD